MEPNLPLAKKLNRWAWVIAAVVLLLVGMMRRVKIPLPDGWDFSFLPPFHASLNALAAVVLVMAFVYIKQKKVEAHRKAIYVALTLSVLFLISYVLYHFTMEETRFGGEGTIRTIYFFLLITHVVLAGVLLPFILFTFIRAYTGQIEKHRKMARWVYPLWLYVAVSGPIVYLMLRPYY